MRTAVRTAHYQYISDKTASKPPENNKRLEKEIKKLENVFHTNGLHPVAAP